MFTDITKIQEQIKQLDIIASHDKLTGLFNRRMCDIALAEMDVEDNYPLAIFIGDVNNLKYINDTLGHDYGDQVIAGIASVLKRYIPEDGFAARLGGDEYLIVMPCMTERGCQMFIKLVANKCQELSESGDLEYSIALGYAIKMDSSVTIADVKAQADANMYMAKQNLKNSGKKYG